MKRVMALALVLLVFVSAFAGLAYADDDNGAVDEELINAVVEALNEGKNELAIAYITNGTTDIPAIEALNVRELRLFNFLTTNLLRDYTEFSDGRNAKILSISGSDFAVDIGLNVQIMGIDKNNNEVARYYLVNIIDGFYFACDMTSLVVKTPVPISPDLIDYNKINAALEEYWSMH